jgi:pantoate--beta-alanine ligase
LPKRNGLVVARTRTEAREWRRQAQGKRVAFVPTMGALHAGHLGLIQIAREKADIVAASIFVNPTQFAANEDLSTYPRAEDSDLQKLTEAGCAFCYCPSPTEMYPPGDSTRVKVTALSHILEGEVRPHFFEGVASVVCRLFLHVAPDVAVFGEKDYQQLLVIRRMVQDLGFPIEIVGGPTKRETDGLAMSSRNAYLDADARSQAAALYRVMTDAAGRIEAGERISTTTEDAQQALAGAGFASVDYVTARRADTLAPFGGDTAPVGVTGRLLVAARMGKTRLIDNMAFVRK